jgi:hypothetical protein
MPVLFSPSKIPTPDLSHLKAGDYDQVQNYLALAIFVALVWCSVLS